MHKAMWIMLSLGPLFFLNEKCFPPSADVSTAEGELHAQDPMQHKSSACR